MPDTAITVTNLSKKYKIGHLQQRHDTLRDALADSIHNLGSQLRKPSTDKNETDVLWALRDVSFEVEHGEVLGVIGRNGAGKSTLLKVLSRITAPTSGRAVINGRVGSLLEVGTGFHPELSGRENIYLNGAILGMKREEIERKFDEIVAFSEIEKFLDTPVKRYSSGMYVRLAFAVAAHLEPEILLVDEVLAVGDAAFQKRCLGKMGDVARSGRTILFVSHNMVAIKNLCEKAIWLDFGKISAFGMSSDVVNNYLQSTTLGATMTERVWNDSSQAPGNDLVRLHKVCVRPDSGPPNGNISMRTPLILEFEYWNLIENSSIDIQYILITEEQTIAFESSSSFQSEWRGTLAPRGLIKSKCYIPGNLLNSGIHRIALRFYQDSKRIYELEDALIFEVFDTTERNGSWYGKFPGSIRPLLIWETEVHSKEIL